MALIHCDFHSRMLGLATSLCAIIPESCGPVPPKGGRRAKPAYPVLYLLHGLSDDHTIWQRRTSIERYAAPLNLAVIMPAVHRSFYADMPAGGRYWTFISEELPELVQALFPVSTARKDTFVAGLSMGGYGAFKLALRRPERFAAAASLSGALDLASWIARRMPPHDRSQWTATFGNLRRVAGSPNDLFYLLKAAVRAGKPLPRLFQCCGTEDPLLADNRRFLDLARSLKVSVTYEEGPGQHEWGYWDRQIRNVLAWIGQKRHG